LTMACFGHHRFWVVLPLLLVVGRAAGQHRSDPLTDPEVDQLRDVAQDADQRLALYVTFARARLATIEQARSDPKITDKAQAIHDRLQDFVDVYDELNDNIDTFVGRKADLRKALKTIIDADDEFQAKLRALKDSARASTADTKQYEFVLSDAMEDVDTSVTDHRQLLTEQEAQAKLKKERKQKPQ
jgi:hypothetical protein